MLDEEHGICGSFLQWRREEKKTGIISKHCLRSFYCLSFVELSSKKWVLTRNSLSVEIEPLLRVGSYASDVVRSIPT